MRKLLVLIPTTLLFTGCAMNSSEFSCNAINEGVGCKPMHKVDKMIASGSLDHDGTKMPDQMSDNSSLPYAYQDTKKYTNPQGWNGLTPNAGDPVRVEEQTSKLWIAPYKDSDNVYHAPHYLYFVSEKSHWVDLPVEAVKSEY